VDLFFPTSLKFVELSPANDVMLGTPSPFLEILILVVGRAGKEECQLDIVEWFSGKSIFSYPGLGNLKELVFSEDGKYFGTKGPLVFSSRARFRCSSLLTMG
jgi:hypothetical protein